MTPNTLKAYIVALSFEPPGPLHVHTWIAPDAPSAVALATVHFMRHAPPTENLMACLTIEMPADQLRHQLRAVEGKLPDSGNAQVVSLVPKELNVPCRDTEHEWHQGTDGWQACKRCGTFLTPHEPVEKQPLDAADASTFIGHNVDRLWDSQPKYWGHRGNLSGSVYVYDEPFGPPMPPAA